MIKIQEPTLKYNIKRGTCIRSSSVKPDLTPKIYSLSINTALIGTYTRVYVYGVNFLPSNVSRVEFGGIAIDTNYLNFNTIYFDVPSVVFSGIYSVVVKNIITLKAISVTGRSNNVILTSNKVSFYISS
jgi:hypothetical protein